MEKGMIVNALCKLMELQKDVSIKEDKYKDAKRNYETAVGKVVEHKADFSSGLGRDNEVYVEIDSKVYRVWTDSSVDVKYEKIEIIN